MPGGWRLQGRDDTVGKQQTAVQSLSCRLGGNQSSRTAGLPQRPQEVSRAGGWREEIIILLIARNSLPASHSYQHQDVQTAEQDCFLVRSRDR